MKLIGRVPIPSIRIEKGIEKLREKYEVEEYDEYSMDVSLYERIKRELKNRNIGSDEIRIRQFVNRLIKSRPSLYRQYSVFHEIYKKIKKREESEKLIKSLLKKKAKIKNEQF